MADHIYDAHVHFGPSTQWVPYINPEVSIDDVLEVMEIHNIQKSVVFPNPHIGDKYPELNDLMTEAQKKHADKIIGFGRVDPRRGKEAKIEIKRIHGLGLSGVKLHPYVECFRPDHPFFLDFFGTINDLDMIILIHTGTMFSSPGYLKPILKKFPDLKIILGHLQEGCISLMRDYENIYSDTSTCRVHLLEYACETCEDRIMFGSDYPYLSHRVQMEVVRAADISESVKNKIFSGNFKEVFP
ncbi:MAG: amidohydrolase [Methanomassiliicoccales archaeon]|nr:MAG: amidohydrolase [Methanomassiliicoccales archaeon]